MDVKIGIVTVLFNSDDVLPDFFESLSRQRMTSFVLYVIDNSKTDSGSQISRQLADRHGIDCRVVFNNFNGGVAKGNNQGIELALKDRCDYILLANNDTYFTDPDLLSKLIEPIERGVATLVTPKIKYFGSNRIWCAGGRMLEWRGTTRHIGDKEEDVGQFEQSGPITYAPTCFMMFPSRILTSSSPMDEKYFVYYDDTDFIWANNQRGNVLWYLASAELFHKVSFSTGGDETDFSIYYMSRNRTYFILKNFPFLKKIFAMVFMLTTRPFRYPAKISKVLTATWDGIRLYAR